MRRCRWDEMHVLTISDLIVQNPTDTEEKPKDITTEMKEKKKRKKEMNPIVLIYNFKDVVLFASDYLQKFQPNFVYMYELHKLEWFV